METVHGILESGGMEFGYTYHNNQPSEIGSSLAPNLIHSLDGWVVRYVVENAPFQVFHVHDELKCHPNNMTALTLLYKEAFIKLTEEDILSNFLGRQLDIDFTAVRAGIADAEYALC